jgi:hypothetical protein
MDTTTTKFQVKPDYYTSEKDCKENEKKIINTNPRYKFFFQTHFTAGDIDQFEQYRDSTNGSLHIPTHRKNSLEFPLPPQIKWSKYKDLDQSAVDNTFKYLFYKFKKCIFLKIKNGNLRVFLPFSNKNFVNEWADRIKIDPSFQDFNDFMKHISSLEGYKFHPNKINKFIDSWYSNNCLVRCEFPIHEGDTNVPNTSDMFHTLCKEREIPDMEFFVNRRDFPLLKTNSTEPYSHIYDTSNMPLLSHNYSKYSPILSMVTAENFADLPIPTGDDWARVCASENKFFSHSTSRTCSDTIPWSSKKPIALFRGSSTGAGVTIETNPRLKLSYISSTTPKNTHNLPLLDAGITKWNLRPRKIKGHEYLQTINIKSLPFGLVKFMSPQEQTSYKYLINVDGHVSSFRLSRELESGSCILLVASKYKLWFRTMIKPFVHYVPVKSDLSDLLDRIRWCNQNDLRCKRIAHNAMRFAKTYLTREGILDYLQRLLIEVKNQNGVYLYNHLSPKEIQLSKEICLLQSHKPLLDIASFLQLGKKTKDIFSNSNTCISEYLFSGKHIVQKVQKKDPLEESKTINSLAHEVFISLKTNGLPNFVYYYGLYDDYILLESVKGVTFSQYIKGDDFTIENYVIIIVQLSLALSIAQDKFSFVHNDLTPWNIIIKTLPSYTRINYKIGSVTYTITTNIIPVIIDLGRAHIVHDSQHYGNINMFSCSTIQDVLTLLVTSISDILKFNLDDNHIKSLVLIANFLTHTGYCSKPFTHTSLNNLRTFFTKASKYTELISSDKHELENKTPLDFVHHLRVNFGIKQLVVQQPFTNSRHFTQQPFTTSRHFTEKCFSDPELILSLLEEDKLSPVDRETIRSISNEMYSQNLIVLGEVSHPHKDIFIKILKLLQKK